MGEGAQGEIGVCMFQKKVSVMVRDGHNENVEEEATREVT